MASVDKYADYSAVQLATETAFISWVKCPDAAHDLFWKEYLFRYPSQSGVVEKARTLVSGMQVVKEPMEEERAVATWNRISARINQLSTGSLHRPVIFMRKWVAAAAVLIVLLGAGSYFLYRQTKNGMANTDVREKKLQNDLAPGGNKAILTLANGSRIVLDSAGNGAITKQGNVTVIKLDDGRLSYRETAGVKDETAVSYNTISTPRGGQYQLVLSDGTKVWLNAASSLTFPTAFVGNERKIEMTGEAYFEVAHNAEKPFNVQLYDGSNIQVLGTQFNVNAYEDEAGIKTTLLEGSVKLRKDRAIALIAPGEQARINQTSDKITVTQDVGLEDVVAWKNGKFQFNQADIKTIMRQIARWYDVKVIYEGEVPDKKFKGKIYRNVNASQVLNILEEGGIHFKIDGNKVIVKP